MDQTRGPKPGQRIPSRRLTAATALALSRPIASIGGACDGLDRYQLISELRGDGGSACQE
jgi:hypothetical protein